MASNNKLMSVTYYKTMLFYKENQKQVIFPQNGIERVLTGLPILVKFNGSDSSFRQQLIHSLSFFSVELTLFLESESDFKDGET